MKDGLITTIRNLTMNEIQKIFKTAYLTNQPYPITFEALKNAGLKKYTIWLGESFRRLCVDNSGEFNEEGHEDYTPLSISTTFDENGIIDALLLIKDKKINYIGFLELITKFGVSHYVVEVEKHTVTYFNPDERKSYVQHIPNISIIH